MKNLTILVLVLQKTVFSNIELMLMEDRVKCYNNYIKWRSQFVEGPAKVPDGSNITIEELKKQGLIGLYRLKKRRINER